MERKLIPETSVKVGFVLERACKTLVPGPPPPSVSMLPIEVWVHWPPVLNDEYGYRNCAGGRILALDRESTEKVKRVLGKKNDIANYVVCTCAGRVVE